MSQKREVSHCLAKYYSEMFDKFGATSMGVGWGNIEERARRRYMEMIRIIREFKDNKAKLRVVDVGCGYGALINILEEEGLIDQIDYSGIDIVDNMTTTGGRLHPKMQFINGDFLEMENNEYDIGICNGILTQKREISESKMDEYLYEIVGKLFSQSKVGCSFNVMSEFVDYKSDVLYYPRMNLLMEYIVGNLTRKIVTSHHYGGLHEVTLHLYR